MNSQPRTIQIFLPFDSPRGIKIAEITNRTVQAIYIPRNQLETASERPEIHSAGLYFLFGQKEEDSKPKVYIGEAEDCFERLKNHNREKDFWESAIVFVTNNAQNQFTKTDVKYLENKSYTDAMDTNRFQVNQTIPTKSFVPEWRQADLEDIFTTMSVLLSTLGFPVFEKMRKAEDNESEEIYYCKGKETFGSGEYNEEGFVVFKGSLMRLKTTKTFPKSLLRKRDNLLSDGIIEEKGNQLVFLEDYQFSSPSMAADMLLGRSANGWIAWKNKFGKTLDEMKRQ